MQHVELPRDEFGHSAAPHEWWYFAAFLSERESGKKLHYVSAFMRYRLAWVSYMRLRGDHMDEVLKRMVYISPVDSGASTDRLRLGAPDDPTWGAELNRVGNSRHRLGEHATLYLNPGDTGAVLQTEPASGGIVNYGGNNEMAWYSRPWLRVTGHSSSSSGQQKMVGAAWFEHQWGNTDFKKLAWRYTPALLNDGQRLIAYAFEHEDYPGARRADVALLRNGFAEPLPDHSMSPALPGGAETTITGPGTHLVVSAQPAHGRITLNVPGAPPFYEGESTLTGQLLGQPAQGVAMTEYHPL